MAWDTLSLTFQDSYGRRKTKTIDIENQALIADEIAIAVAFSTALEAVTDLALVRCNIILEAVDPGFDAQAGSNVDVGATFTALLEDANGKKASFKVPGIKDALVAADGSIALTGAVKTMLDFFVTLTPYDLGLSDGETAEVWLKGTLDK